jgi:hypothetical protein
MTACVGDGDKPVIEVNQKIAADTAWTSDNVYCLSDLVFVDAELSIEAGTLIQGTADGALVITRDGRIDAAGTAEAPIVFTSSLAAGERQTSDWKGLAMLGRARTNKSVCVHVVDGEEVEVAGSDCVAGSDEYYFRDNIEGIDPTNDDGRFGGIDDTHDCGHLRYVRVEFAGAVLGTDNELNGITLGGCGSDTLLEYVQVHRGLDDGIEHFGGAANMRYIVLSSEGDDALDWDNGYRGKVQFLIVHHGEGSSSDPRAFEADSLSSTDIGIVQSNAKIWNATLIGVDGGQTQAMMLREGVAATMRNFVITGFDVGGVEILHDITYGGWGAGDLVLSNAFFWANVNAGVTPEITTLLEAAALDNTFDVDPMLGSATPGQAGFAVPSNTALNGQATPPDDGFFEISATFAGAIAPGATGAAVWYEGWTAFPVN